MARQVHGVMEQPQDFDHFASVIVADPEHHEMNPSAAVTVASALSDAAIIPGDSESSTPPTQPA